VSRFWKIGEKNSSYGRTGTSSQGFMRIQNNDGLYE